MKRVIQSLIAVGLCLTMAELSSAQAPQTLSHQGFLTNPAGVPVPDAVRTMIFKIYDAASSGTELWTETKNVETIDGRFNVVLGDTTVLFGFSWDQQLWLGTKVGADPEMTPRTKLTSAPSAMGLVLPYVGNGNTTGPSFKVRNVGTGEAIRASTTGNTAIVSLDRIDILTNQIGDPDATVVNEDLHIQASDALIGLYSNPAGGAGSGIQLGELSGGSLVNKWSMYRGTTGAKASLRFTFGQLPSYGDNPLRVEFDTTGRIHAAALIYDNPRTHFYSVGASEFKSGAHFSGEDYVTGGTGAWIIAGGNTLLAPVHLPDGADIKSITCYVYDNSSLDIKCSLSANLVTGSSIANASIASAQSSGVPGDAKISVSNIAFSPVDNKTMLLFLAVAPVSGGWITVGSDLKVRMIVIEYEISEAE